MFSNLDGCAMGFDEVPALSPAAIFGDYAPMQPRAMTRSPTGKYLVIIRVT
jgi:hypothetical protein